MSFSEMFLREVSLLKEELVEFSRKNPELMPFIGEGSGELVDPFVSQLFEGVAFLSAKINARLDEEFSDFSRQALSHLFPYFQSVTPSIAVFQLHPDFSSPELFRSGVVHSGVAITLDSPDRKKPLTFSIPNEMQLLPMQLGEPRFSFSIPSELRGFGAQKNHRLGYLKIDFSIVGGACVADIFDVKRNSSINVFVAGDDAAAARVFLMVVCKITRMFLINEQGHSFPVDVQRCFPSIRSTVGDFIGGVYGLSSSIMILREYLSCPQKFRSFDLDIALELTQFCRQSTKFSIVLELNVDAADVFSDLLKTAFLLYAVPCINLYEKRLDPLIYGIDNLTQRLVVDKTYPNYFHLWSVNTVDVCMTDGSISRAHSVLDEGENRFEDFSAFKYSLVFNTKDSSYSSRGLINLAPSVIGLCLNFNGHSSVFSKVHHMQIKGLVSDLHWKSSVFNENSSFVYVSGVHKIASVVVTPSSPRSAPGHDLCWAATALMGMNPLSFEKKTPLNEWVDITASVLRLTRLVVESNDDRSRAKFLSLQLVKAKRRYMEVGDWDSKGWIFGTEVEVYTSSKGFSFHDVGLFALILIHALSEYVDMNDGFRASVFVDDDLLCVYSNLVREDGKFAVCAE